jgi:hypothetical protein
MMRDHGSRWGIRSVASRRAVAALAIAAALLVASHAGRVLAEWTPTSPEGCPARPDDPVTARAIAGDMFNRAGERADAGANDEAASLYTCSYSIVPHPNTLYNLALVQEAAGQLEDACTVLELYVLQAPNAINRPEAEALLAELRGRIEQAGGTPPGPPPLPDGGGTPPDGGNGNGGTTEPPPDGGGTAGATGPEEEGLSDLALAGWILLGTGVALAAGGGTAFAVLADQEKSLVLHPDPGTPWRDIAPHQDDYDLYTGLEIGFFALGGAAVAVGATLLLVDLGAETGPSPVGVAVPLVGPGMVGLSWSGRFDAF